MNVPPVVEATTAQEISEGIALHGFPTVSAKLAVNVIERAR